MIQMRPGDLVAVEVDSQYYYALILDKIRLFGGNWVFVFHLKSKETLTSETILSAEHNGFYAFVDFIHAKREDRIQRLARGIDVHLYPGTGYLKSTFTHTKKANLWYIYDMEFNPEGTIFSYSTWGGGGVHLWGLKRDENE